MMAIVVDDSAAMRHHLSKTLLTLGWQVKPAGNGTEVKAIGVAGNTRHRQSPAAAIGSDAAPLHRLVQRLVDQGVLGVAGRGMEDRQSKQGKTQR